MKQSIGKIVLCSAVMSVSFTSAVFLSNIVSIANPMLAIVYLLIVAAFYAGMLIFAGFVMLIIQLVLCLFAIIVAVSVKPGNYRKFEQIQLVSGIFFGIVNVIIVVILEMQFPSYQAVMQYINS